ncbi:MAG: hypothetical protein K2K32_04670 [Muribaculaceae bacterium]|nr:hypothetical protein [Muribaculaceae bacterium]
MNLYLRIRSEEVIADLRSAAWLESELHPELDRHRRHEMADICEEDNIERVWRVLGIAASQVRLSLQKILCLQKPYSPENDLEQPESWEFHFKFPLQKSTLSFIKEKIHEYFVAVVMSERCAVIISKAAGTWKERADASLAELKTLATTWHPPHSHVRRPLWPL